MPPDDTVTTRAPGGATQQAEQLVGEEEGRDHVGLRGELDAVAGQLVVAHERAGVVDEHVEPVVVARGSAAA